MKASITFSRTGVGVTGVTSFCGGPMSRGRKARSVETGFEIVNIDNPTVADKPYNEDETETDEDRKRLAKRLARSMEWRIKEVTNASLGYWPAEILNIKFDADGLLVSTWLPFPLLRPSRVTGEWPPRRAEQESLRDRYAEYLLTSASEKELASFYFQKLVNFLIEHLFPVKLNTEVIKHLKRISQRALAGRPAEAITPEMRQRIISDGQSISEKVETIKTQITLWQKKGPLQDRTILTRLRSRYPPSKFAWIEHFLSLSPTFPRRRYLSKSDDASRYSEDGNLPSCKISEPEDWSMIDIVAKVLQAHLREETRKRIALLKIKALIR
jgi:hypothetical protein